MVGLCRVIILTLLLATGTTRAQNLVEWDADLTDRPIAEIIIDGAEAGVEQLIRNNIRAAIGDPSAARCETPLEELSTAKKQEERFATYVRDVDTPPAVRKKRSRGH